MTALSLFALLCVVAVPASTGADSSTARLDGLETTLFGKTKKQMPPEKRMSAIEKNVFGKTKQGPLKQRLDAVSKLVDTKSTTQLMPPVAPVKESSANATAAVTEVKQGHVNVDEVHATDATAMLNRGIALESQGKTQEAVALFHQVISSDHYNANAFFNLGVVAEKHGDLQGALQNYRIAASINPADGEFQQAVASVQTQLTPRRPVFATPPYMVPQVPIAQQPQYQAPILSVPYRTPPQLTVSEPPRKGHPVLGATARFAAIGAASLLLGGGRMGGIDISCPLCRMLGGL
jgi:tetratricopeptide (TPR) repeat protein